MLIQIPYEPELFGININVHLVLEYLAFFVAYRYYTYLKKIQGDKIASSNRLSIILGAALGALIGSRVFAWLEYPFIIGSVDFFDLMNTKTIMGGLFGGLLGVESAKKIINEQRSSGDLFVFPIIVGIIIGRVGCFLSGIKEFTYGAQTDFVFGMDLGDGFLRHPTSLYEIVYLIILFFLLKRIAASKALENGLLFKFFMIAYFGFRFMIEFIKPNEFLIFGLSSIQYLCLICLLYYRHTITSTIKNACKKVYLL